VLPEGGELTKHVEQVGGKKKTFPCCSLSSDARNEYFIGRGVEEKI
jgi:hypothetical protein